LTDLLQARLDALRVLRDVLAGRITRVGELRKRWPSPSGDHLLQRALHEAEHYLVTHGELERRFVDLLGRFLESGGAPQELDAAYDEVIREHRESQG
jgi:hypothetical protein